MFYILIVPGTEPVYPYTLTDLKRANPETSFPKDMTNFDTTPWYCYPVQDTTPPEAPNMVAIRIMPELVDNVWYERWELQPAAPTPIPKIVTMRQARLALLQNELLNQVDISINNIQDETEREQVRITWEYATEVERNNPMIKNLSERLGLTSDQLDNLFILASTL